MAVTEKTKEKGNLIEGLHFYTLRAQLKEFSRKADKANKILGILIPIFFLIWYIVPIARAQGIDYDLIKNCILLVLVVIEFLFNINYAVSDNGQKEKRTKGKMAKCLYWIRTILFSATCCVAIFDVITYNNSIWNTIVAAGMFVALAAKLAATAVSLIIKKVAGPILIAAFMDIEKILESKPVKAFDGKTKLVEELDEFIKTVGNIEDDTAHESEEKCDIFDSVCKWAGDSKEKRKELMSLADKLKEEEEANKEKKFKKAREKLIRHAGETVEKAAKGVIKSKFGRFIGK